MQLEPGDIAIDYSYARPDVHAIVEAGVKLVVRYISPNRGNLKNVTVEEIQALHAAGLSVLLVWEDKQISPLGGAINGTSHGLWAKAFAKDLGYPSDVQIIAAIDINPVWWDTQAGMFVSRLPVIMEYLHGFYGAVMPAFEMGVYGNNDVVTAAAEAGISTLGWQTRAWSAGRLSPHAHVRQEIGFVHPDVATLGSVDDNTVLRAFRAWSTVIDEPTPVPVEEEAMFEGFCKASDGSFWARGVEFINGAWQQWTCKIQEIGVAWEVYRLPLEEIPLADLERYHRVPAGPVVSPFTPVDYAELAVRVADVLAARLAA